MGAAVSLLVAACGSAGPSAPVGAGTSSVKPPSSDTPTLSTTPVISSTGTPTSPPATTSASPSPSPSPGPGPSTAIPTQGAPSGVCASSQLTLAVGTTNGAAGSTYTTFFLTNSGQQACTLQGYPGVSVLDAAGSMVGQPADRSGPAGQPIAVAPGIRAQFGLAAGRVPRPGCAAPQSSTQIQVYPPDQTVPIVIPFATMSCALQVTAITS